MTEVKKLRVELLVASPPTSKCKLLISQFENIVHKNPKLQLDIYYAGNPPQKNTTEGFKKNIDKRVKIPIAFVNGCQLEKEILSDEERILGIIQQELAKNPSKWYS